jgi:Polysaccharide lyase family 4, domain II
MRGIAVSASLMMAAAGLLGWAVSAPAYEAVSVADGGSIKGKVVFNGTVPPKRKVVPTKDREVCGSGVREVDQILVGGDKSVQEAVVYLKAVEKGKAWPKLPKTPEIDNVKCDFQPHVMAMPVGDIVVVNTDPVLHNTKSFIDRVPIFNLALPNQGQRITRPIKKSGIMRVECDAHGWMLGWVYVADSPYYAITSKDGTFSIADIPPGNYTLVAWQEFTGPTEIPITVKAKEAATLTVELKK